MAVTTSFVVTAVQNIFVVSANMTTFVVTAIATHLVATVIVGSEVTTKLVFHCNNCKTGKLKLEVTCNDVAPHFFLLLMVNL